MKPFGRAFVAVLALGQALTVGAAQSVDIDYRLRADLDLIAEHVAEDVTTVRVLEDRGLVARANAGGMRFPTTRHVINRERLRYTTGPAEADGSFHATLAVLSRRSSVRLFNGDEQPLAGQPEMDNLSFQATVDPQGKLLQPSLQAEGLDGARRDAVQALLANVLEQATRVDALHIDMGKTAQRVVNMKLPLPGLPPMDLRLTTSNRLIEVVDGQARIELVYVMDFTLPDGPMKMDASGTGGGTMLYDTAARLARSIDTSTLMTIVTELPDGTVEMQMNSRHTQTMRAAER